MEKPITTQDSMPMIEKSKGKAVEAKKKLTIVPGHAKGTIPAGLAKYLAEKKAKAGKK